MDRNRGGDRGGNRSRYGGGRDSGDRDPSRDRQYDRQQRDRAGGPAGPSGPPQRTDLGNEDQVRRLRHAMDRSAAEVIRCQKCGTQQRADVAFVGPLTRCDKCGSSLHSCRHCMHFDTGARFACKKPIEAALPDKWAGNSCTFYEPRLVLDATGRRVEGKAASTPKNAFDALFKK